MLEGDCEDAGGADYGVVTVERGGEVFEGVVVADDGDCGLVLEDGGEVECGVWAG